MGKTEINYSMLRETENPDANKLKDYAVDWILSLSPNLRPHGLAKQYPRIANVLAAKYGNQKEFGEALVDYVFDSRGIKRQGFPAESLADLMRLLDDFNQKNDRTADVWGMEENFKNSRLR